MVECSLDSQCCAVFQMAQFVRDVEAVVSTHSETMYLHNLGKKTYLVQDWGNLIEAFKPVIIVNTYITSYV